MPMKKILCAVDLADNLTSVAEYACSLAKGSGAEVELVSVAPEPSYYIGLRVFHDSDDEARKKIVSALEPKLAEFAEKHFPGMKVKTTLLYGDPSTELLAYAKKKAWDLMVVGTHGRKGIDKLLLGSVAQKLVNLVEMPVLSIHP